MTIRGALHDMLCLLGALALAWGFHVYARVLPTGMLVASWGVFALLIATGAFHRARLRRRAFLAVYIAGDSPLQGWLRGGVLMGLGAVVTGSVLALALMVGLARSTDPWQWMALVAGVPLLVALRAALMHRMARHAHPVFLPLLSWRVAALASGAVLVAAFVWLAYYQVYPAFAGVSLERAVWHMVDQEQVRSAPWRGLLEAMAAVDGLRHWLAQQLLPAPGTSFLHFVGWLLLLAEQSLFVWSYLLMGYGVLAGLGAHDRTWD